MNKDEIIARLVESGITETNEITGCSNSEIAALETSVGAPMPEQYREFLLAAGHGAGRLFQGTDIFYRSLAELKSEAESLLKENNEKFTLPVDALVMSMHQGYEFKYFLLSDGNDPPIYQYIEGSGAPSVAWASFSNFLGDSFSSHATAFGSKST